MRRRKFDKEFKVRAVRLVEEKGGTVTAVARELGVDPGGLHRWRERWKAAGEQAFPGNGKRQAGQKRNRVQTGGQRRDKDSPIKAKPRRYAPKTHYAGFRVDAQQLQRLGELAARVGLTKSDLIRAALEAVRREPALLTSISVNEVPSGRKETP